MTKYAVYGALLVGVALSVSLPIAAIAGGPPHRQYDTQDIRHRASQRLQRNPRHQHHSGFRAGFRSGFRVGIFFGSRSGAHHVYHHYPHGHHLHVHDSRCPVVVETHVYHHAFAAPVWEVHHYKQHKPSPMATLHIVITPHQGDVFVDGRFLGQARKFRAGQVRVPVTPGRHTVQLHLGGTAYKKQIRVEAGSTAVVNARRM